MNKKKTQSNLLPNQKKLKTKSPLFIPERTNQRRAVEENERVDEWTVLSDELSIDGTSLGRVTTLAEGRSK